MRFAAQKPEGVDIPSERTVYRVMKEIGLVHHIRGNVKNNAQKSLQALAE